MTRYLIGIPAILAIGSLIISMLLATLLWLTYSNLTKENLVSIITFDKVEAKDNVYTAHVFSSQGDEVGDYLIYGDQWRLDAAFIKMKYWANVLGVDSKYALNRIEGRYENIQDENNKTHKSYQLDV